MLFVVGPDESVVADAVDAVGARSRASKVPA
jgi:hypothetical protein